MKKAEALLQSLRRHGLRSTTPSLGERELTVLDVLWATSDLSASEVHSQLSGVGISLNTVQSTLERLVRKKLLVREKRARAFYYSAAVTRAELIGTLIHAISRDIAGGELMPMLSGFANYLSSGPGNGLEDGASIGDAAASTLSQDKQSDD